MSELIDPRETAGLRWGGDEWTDYIIEQNRYKVIELINSGRLSLEGLDQNVVDKALSARNGHKNVFLAGVIRNDGAPNYWQLLPIETNHRPINIDSVETDGAKITIRYPSIGANHTVLFIAVPDETLASKGLIMGTSVTEDRTEIRMSQVQPILADYIYYDGTAWQSQLGVITVQSYANGILTLAHPATLGDAPYNISVTPRGGIYKGVVSNTSPASTSTSLVLEIRDVSPPASGYIYYDSTNGWVVPAGWSATFSAGLLTVTHPSIPSSAANNIGFTNRGTARATVAANGSPLTSTQILMNFRDSADAIITSPNTEMKVWIQHGGGQGTLASNTPNTDMKFFISHGGGMRVINPQQLDTALYPFSNIWLFGIMELPD